MEIKIIGITTITEKGEVMCLNDWLVTDDTMLTDYLSRELEYTDKGEIKSSTTNIITVLVNPSYCVKEGEL